MRATAAAVRLLNAVPAPLAARLGSRSRGARLLRPALNTLLPSDLVVATVRSGPNRGLSLAIDPATEKFYWTGAYEEPVQEALVALLRPGDVFWDVGAHIGFFSMLASRIVGPSGAVHALEPVAENRDRLIANIARNGAANIVVHEIAAAASSGRRPLRERGSSSMWSLGAPGAAGRAVACNSLDDLSAALPPPALVKIDVEGLEAEVVAGASGLVSEARPKLIVEVHDGDVAGIRKLLPGYAARQLSPTHWLFERGASH